MQLQRVFVVSCVTVLLSWHVQAYPKGPGGGPRYSKPGDREDGGRVPKPVLEFHQALGWIKTYAARLEKSQGARLPQTRQPLEQIQNDAKFLQQKWLVWAQEHPRSTLYYNDVRRDSYFRSLQGTQRQLEKLHKSSDEVILETITDVAADLHAKAENCRHSTDGLGKEIKVMVRTRKGTEEVAGYEVWCSPRALVKFKDEHIRFPKISSPTILKNMAPGRYEMWVEKGTDKTKPVTQTIGGKGETELEIDLLIPAGSDRPQ